MRMEYGECGTDLELVYVMISIDQLWICNHVVMVIWVLLGDTTSVGIRLN